MSKKLDCGIYKITNLINNKVYIGQSKILQKRLRYHRNGLKGNYHSNKHLQRSYNNYGIENFKFEVIKYVDNTEDLIYWEQHYIDFYKSYLSEYGYNNSRYVNLVYYPNEDVRRRISKNNKGKKVTEENKIKTSKMLERKTKEKQPNLSTGITNITYLSREKYYQIAFKSLDCKFCLEGVTNLQLAILLRDLFYGYKTSDLETYKTIFKQCNRPNGYFNVVKCDKGYYTSRIKINGKLTHIKKSKDIKECALAYNNFVLENQLDLPLNIIPLTIGKFDNNSWFCELNIN